MKQGLGGYEAKKNIGRRSGSNGGCKIEASIRRMMSRKHQEKFASSSSSSSFYSRIRSVKLQQQHNFQVPSLIVNRDQTEDSKTSTTPDVQTSLIPIEKVIPTRHFSSKQRVELVGSSRSELFLETVETHIRNLMKTCRKIDAGVMLNRNWKSSPSIPNDVNTQVTIYNHDFDRKTSIGVEKQLHNNFDTELSNHLNNATTSYENYLQNNAKSKANHCFTNDVEIYGKNPVKEDLGNCLDNHLKCNGKNLQVYDIHVDDEHQQVTVTVKNHLDLSSENLYKNIHSKGIIENERISEFILEDNGISEILNNLIKNFENSDEETHELPPKDYSDKLRSLQTGLEEKDGSKDEINRVISLNEQVQLSTEHISNINDDDKLQKTSQSKLIFTKNLPTDTDHLKDDNSPFDHKRIIGCEQEKLKNLSTMASMAPVVNNNLTFCHLKKDRSPQLPSNELEIKFKDIRARLDKQLQNYQAAMKDSFLPRKKSIKHHCCNCPLNQTEKNQWKINTDHSVNDDFKQIIDKNRQRTDNHMEGQKAKNNQQNLSRRIYSCACKIKSISSPRKVNFHLPNTKDDSKFKTPPESDYCQCASNKATIIAKPDENQHIHKDLIRVCENLKTTETNASKKCAISGTQMSSILKAAFERAALLPENPHIAPIELDLEQDWDENSVNADDFFNDHLTHIVFPKETRKAITMIRYSQADSY